MSNFCIISFPDTDYTPITIETNQKLSEHLTIHNSPVLFGCRTGICGSCLVTVIGDIPPPKLDEQEILDIFAPNVSNARLACQIELTNSIQVSKLN